MHLDLVTRTDAQTMKCPRCHADPGTNCQGRRGEREANHMERVNAYRAVRRRALNAARDAYRQQIRREAA